VHLADRGRSAEEDIPVFVEHVHPNWVVGFAVGSVVVFAFALGLQGDLVVDLPEEASKCLRLAFAVTHSADYPAA
jgi:hypothetical protein